MKNLFLLLLFFLFSIGNLSSQIENNWQHRDPHEDRMMGVSTHRAINYLEGKTSEKVIVAIIDNGADIDQKDIQANIWVNTDEIPDNGIDDDNNSYIDDVNGWNFLGNQKGDILEDETLAITRLYKLLHKKYSNKTKSKVPKDKRKEFEKYQEVKTAYNNIINNLNKSIYNLEEFKDAYISADDIVKELLEQESYTEADVNGLQCYTEKCNSAKYVLSVFYDNGYTLEDVEKEIENFKKQLKTRYNTNLTNRYRLVGDDPDDFNDRIYGNNRVSAGSPAHGTSVAGLVGATENNDCRGVSDNVELMIIRIVPNGDERDKDVAMAIIYAVDNGAKVINCSFTKKYSCNPEMIQKAIEYAQKNDVLIVAGAGNTADDIDELTHYPNAVTKSGLLAENYISVGASALYDDKFLVAYFSNYGHERVDVFAPGYNIQICTLGNKYQESSGTSLSSPIVAGIAAVIRSYYPQLSASQVKEAIENSVFIPETEKVIMPGTEDKMIAFSKLSKSGGIANLYNAILYIEKNML